MKSHQIVFVTVISLLLCLPLSGEATLYTFTTIADTSGAFSGFSTAAFINDSGIVAFLGGFDDGEAGIFTGSGGALTTIVVKGAFPSLDSGISINNSGTVAFSARLDNDGGSGVFTGNGGPLTTRVDSSGGFSSFSGVAINDGGTVAFSGRLDVGGFGIFTSNASSTTTIADTSTFSSFGGPSINNSGTVTFFAIFNTSAEKGIFTGNGGPLTTIADPSGMFSSFLSAPSINSNGTVGFVAVLDAGGIGVFTGNGGSTNTIADDSGTFTGFIDPSINDTGTVAFWANLGGAGQAGIFTGHDPVADKVIRTGAPLDGSIVTNLFLFNDGNNNNGQLAFWAKLADGREGIFRANPQQQVIPEPSTLVLFTIAILGMFGFCWLNRRRTSAKNRRFTYEPRETNHNRRSGDSPPPLHQRGPRTTGLIGSGTGEI